MKLEKPIMWLVNLLLSLFFAFGILQFLEQFSSHGWAWYSRSLCCWPIILCFLAGLVGRQIPRLKYPLLGGSVFVALALMTVLFPAYRFLDIVYLLCAAVLGAVLYILGLRGEEPFPSRVAVASLLVYIAACVFFFNGDYQYQDYAPLTWCGLFAFTLSLYSFNAASLYTGVHNAKGGESMAIPTGIRGKNMLLLTLFLIGSMLLGSLKPLHRALDSLWHWLLHCFAVFIKFLTNVSGGGSSGPATATPTPEPVETAANALEMMEEGKPTFVMIYGIILGICAVVFFLLAYGFAKEGHKGGGKLRKWVRGLFNTREILEYEDDVERTADLKSLLQERRDKAKKWMQKLRTRQERYEDMPDERMKIRFVYRALLRSGRVAGWTPSATPDEVGSSLRTEVLRQMTADYDTARYDEDHEITPEQAARGREALAMIQRRK